MLTYFYTAILVAGFITYNFLQDKNAPKGDLGSWLFVVLAALIWPVTLPNIVRKVMFARSESIQAMIHSQEQVKL